MKIKEVCKRTGLSERTVRFYVEKGLLKPESKNEKGRNITEYSEEDVNALIDISKLRKAGFSILDILHMQKSIDNVSEVVVRRCSNLEEEQIQNNELIRELKKASVRENISWRKLANILFPVSNYNEKICYPLEECETNENTRTMIDIIKRVIVVISLLVLFFFVVFVFVYQCHNSRLLTSDFSLGQVVVEDKWREENKQYISIYSTNPYSEAESFFKKPRALRVNSSEYFDALKIKSEPYSSFHIWIEIPYIEAKQLGLIDNEEHILLNNVLDNAELLKQYGTVKAIRDN